jgi:hypothetical protein
VRHDDKARNAHNTQRTYKTHKEADVTLCVLDACRFAAIQDLVGKLSYPVVEGSDGMAAIAAPYPIEEPGGLPGSSYIMPQVRGWSK